MVTSLLIDQEFPGSIADSDVEFFPSGELFHDIYGMGASMFQYPLYMFCPVFSSEETPTLC